MSSANPSPLSQETPLTKTESDAASVRSRALDRVGAILVLFAIPIILLLLVPTQLLPIAFAAVPLYFGLRWFVLGSPFPKTSSNLFLLVFLGIFALAFAILPKYPEGIVLAAHLVAGVMVLYVIFDQVYSVEGMWRAAVLLALIGAGLAIITPFTVPWRGAPMIPIPFVYAQNWPLLFETANVNIMAGALAPTLVVALACVRAPDQRIRILGAVALVPIAIILFLLQSRGAWLGVIVGLIVWAALYNRWLVPALPLFLLGALVLNNVLGGTSPTRFLYGPVGTELNESVGERQELWTQALVMLGKSPLLGIGVGGYEYVAPLTPPLPVRGMKNIPNAHQLFLQVGLDTGVIGLVSFVALWVALAVGVWRGYRGRGARDLAIGVLAAMAMMIAQGWGESAYWGFKASFVMWFVLALALLFDKSKDTIYNIKPLD